MTDTITLPRAVLEQALGALVRAEMMHGQPNQAAQDALRAALQQPQVQSGGIPPNWKLVPVEPADSQIRAAQDTWWHACNCETYWDQIYAAMIAAAPQSPVVAQPQVEREASWYHKHWGEGDDIFYRPTEAVPDGATPLYTHPQLKREPLTDEEVVDTYCRMADGKEWAIGGLTYAMPFARAIERAVWEKSNG